MEMEEGAEAERAVGISELAVGHGGGECLPVLLGVEVMVVRVVVEMGCRPRSSCPHEVLILLLVFLLLLLLVGVEFGVEVDGASE